MQTEAYICFSCSSRKTGILGILPRALAWLCLIFIICDYNFWSITQIYKPKELTLTITSERSDTELELNEDNIEISSINVQSFVDEQEWALHSHVETWKCITTKIFQNSKLKHPSFSTSCRASRRAGFYIWNIFLVMVGRVFSFWVPNVKIIILT